CVCAYPRRTRRRAPARAHRASSCGIRHPRKHGTRARPIDHARIVRHPEEAVMSLPRLVAFDLDDTLAPSKSPITDTMAELLVALARRTEVAIISGGQLAQFMMQVVDRLPQT